MANWRENAADQNLRMAQKMLEQQGEVNSLAAENARLRQQLAAANERTVEQIRTTMAERVAIVDTDYQALKDERDRLQARLDTATAHVAELRGQRDEAREQRNLARRERNIAERVVEAAEAWRSRVVVPLIHERPLANAVDAWRAAQPDVTAPTDRLSATESQDRGADDGAGTEGSRAQGGAPGDCGECYDIAHDEMDEREFCDRHAEPAPADPAGLDAAIEAARHRVRIEGRWPFEVPDHVLKPAVRAAAPHLRAAALNEAADAMEREVPVKQQLTAAAWLRERAGRIGGGE